MKFAKRITALILAFLILSACLPFTFAYKDNGFDDCIAKSNTEFAIKTAEIIKNEDDSDEMLRIMGKFSVIPSDNAFSLANECVISDDGRFVLQFSTEKELLLCLEKLNNNPDIIYAERDRPIYTEALKAENGYLSWGVEAIEADVYSQAIAPSVSGRSVTVAIVDSGSENIDFIKDKLVRGYDFFENDDDAFQDESINSHGTFLASIVADCTRDIPVKIMPVRVLNSKTGSLINAANGIIYAADNGADVINLSLCAALNNCKTLEYAVAYAEEKGVTVVVPAGNSKSDIKDFCPAHCESALTVTSVDSNGIFSERFSNFGNGADLAAPGENISGYNAMGENVTMSGTSMSTAFVSASAAMFILDNPDCNTEQVRTALKSAVKDLGEPGKDNYYGWGIPQLGSIVKPDTVSVNSIKFPQNSFSLSVGDTLEINPVLSPDNSTNKLFKISANNGNVSIYGNTVTAVSTGVTVLTVTSRNGMQDTAEITITERLSGINATLKIKNNPGLKTINYGETLRLTAEITNKPENSDVWWYVDGIKGGEGNTFEVCPENGNVVVTAKLVNADGKSFKDADGNEIFDSQTVSVKSGFFQKLISFFKNLFRINRTVIQKIISL